MVENHSTIASCLLQTRVPWQNVILQPWKRSSSKRIPYSPDLERVRRKQRGTAINLFSRKVHENFGACIAWISTFELVFYSESAMNFM